MCRHKELAEKFELLPKEEAEKSEIVLKVKKWFSQQPKCLLIFDDALDAASLSLKEKGTKF